jgi:N-acetylmuramoyl-L-alanine amidase
MTRRFSFLTGRPGGRVLSAVVAGFVLMAAGRLTAQTPQASFERAQAIEQQLGDSPSVDAIRKAAKAYEAVVLRYPNTGLCDNSLWQEAVLLERAFDRSADPKDRAEAARVLNWLAREYPASAMARQAAARATLLLSSTSAAMPPASPLPSPSPTPSPVSSAPASVSPATVRAITRTPLAKGDRITVELSGEVSVVGDRVPNPDRLYLDFAKTTTAAVLADQIKSLQSPLIKGVRVGNPSQGVTRVVIELVGAPKFSTFSMYGPFRVVVDLESTAPLAASPSPTPSSFAPPSAPPAVSQPPVSAPALTPTPTPKPSTTPLATPSTSPKSTPAPTPTPTPVTAIELQPIAPAVNTRGDYSLARQLGLRVAKIVIDPGHGGHDPGAIANGVTESELVLDVALRLEKLLLQIPGVEVVLTRRTNEFVPLEERTAIANREKADLFLSIHANSHNQPTVRGIETYFLNFSTNPEAEAVAARENAASVERMGTLPAIVKAITLNNKLEESRELATVLQSSLVKGLSAQPGGGRDLGVKQAPFVVLIGAQMPSVLTEIGFLTNTGEAGLFKQAAPRQLIAQSLRDAIVRYQTSLKKVSAAGTDAHRE